MSGRRLPVRIWSRKKDHATRRCTHVVGADLLLALVYALLEAELGLLEDVLGAFEGVVAFGDAVEGVTATHGLGLFDQGQLTVTVLQRLLALL